MEREYGVLKMIICGFPGVGKSTLAKSSNWVDLESTPFEKDWVRYAKVAKHMSDNGYNVMVSTHPQLLEQFEQMEIEYTVVIPPFSDESNYIKRYIKRNNDNNFIKNIENNWMNWLKDIVFYSSVNRTVIILPKDSCLQSYLERYKNT